MDGGAQVAVADGDDEREVSRAQDAERRDEFARAFFIDEVCQDDDERAAFAVGGDILEGARVRRSIISGSMRGAIRGRVHLRGPARGDVSAHAPTEDAKPATSRRVRRRTQASAA